MQRFQTPALPNEFAREPIEQFGVTRLVARFAKVADAANQALSEVMFPNAIDDDSRGQSACGGIGLSQPASERQSPAG